MIWYIISFLVAFLLWILLGPIILFLNTDTNRYFLVLPGIFKATVVPSTELFHIRGWIFFIPYKYDPFQRKKGKRKRETDQKGRKWGLVKLRGGLQMLADTTHSFRIRKLHLDLDTDDFMLNAWLVPIFSFVNSDNIRMRVNFEGTSSLLLDLRTRLGSLLWIVIKHKYKSFFNL
ncbi:MAG: hypothetical protein AMS26_23190 [Bacteroides sp. SM23_62]|nr:MAG: hypothetical protein AMS26_23190 [Bacteroides sp. SM23_62]